MMMLRPLLLLCTVGPLWAATADAAPPRTNVCITCHEALPTRYRDPVLLWKTSVHQANGIFCNDCHGGDPADAANAMSPARGFIGAPKDKAIPEVCGKCHIGVKNDYLQSAHGKRLGNGGPTCVTCHGNHGIQRATLEIINEKNCTRCHSFSRAAEMKRAMEGVEGRIAGLSGRIQWFKGRGADVDAEEKTLYGARNSYRRLFHEVNAEHVKKEAAKVQQELAPVEKKVVELEQKNVTRKMWGAVAVGMSLLATALFWLLGRTYRANRDR